jgi:hypothetical protein
VLVPRSAELYQAPRATAPHWHDRAVDLRREPGSTSLEDAFWVFAVDGEADHGFVPVQAESALGVPGRCYETPDGLAGLKVRFWVKEDALWPVLTEPVAVQYPDGTAVALLPGVAVSAPSAKLEGAEPEVLVRLDGLRFKLKVPASAIATRYVPLAGHLPAVEGTAQQLTPRAGLRLGGHDFDLGRAAFEPIAQRVDRVAGKTFAVLRHACGSYRVEVRTAQGEPAFGPPSTDVEPAGVQGEPPAPNAEILARGAPLFWTDGSPAGTAELDLPLRASELPRAHGRRCFAFDLRVEPARAKLPARIALCADAERISRPPDLGADGGPVPLDGGRAQR